MARLEEMTKEELLKLLQEFQKELAFGKVAEEVPRLVHELKVHQVELEMQNRELREARDQLEDALAMYSDLYDFAPVAYLTLSEKGIIKQANMTGASMLGMEHPRLLYLPLSIFLDKGSDRPFFRHIKECLKKGRAAAELKLRVKGRTLDVQAVSALSESPLHERLIRMTLNDITDRKLAEEYALRLASEHAAREASEMARARVEESEATYRAIGEAIPFGIWIAGPGGDMRYMSRSFLAACGRKMGECAGDRWLECLPAHDAQRVARHWRKCIKEGFYCEMEFSLKSVDGRTLEILSRGAPIRDSGGKITQWAGVNIDITGRKAMEKALSEEKERLAVTLGSIAECVITTDRSGKVFYINKECERFTGVSQNDAIGKKTAEVVEMWDSVESRRFDDPVKAVSEVDDGSIVSGRLELVNRHGLRRKVAGRVAPLRGSRGEVMGNVVVLRDISAIKMAEEEVLRTMKFESLGSLASGIATGFTNLLTSLRGTIELAVDDYPGSKNMLIESIKLVDSMTSLSHQLLVFSAGIKPVKEFIFIDELVRDLAKEVFEGAGVKRRMHFPEGIWLVEVDPGQIREALRNILVNAKEAASPGGSVRLSSKNLEISATEAPALPAGKYLRITVKDSGQGIAPEDLTRVFDPFYTTKAGRSGLGLTIARSIITNNGGFIYIESRPEKGTSVRVYLPASPRQVPV